MRNLSFAPLFFVFFAFACSSKPIASLEINVSSTDRYQVPIDVDLNGLANPGTDVHLLNPQNNKTYPAEIKLDGSLFTVIDFLPEGTHQLELRPGNIGSPNRIRLAKDDQGIQVLNGNDPVFFYQAATAYPREGLPDYYKRSGMIHPLYSPEGQLLTDDFPEGHVHQHAIFNAWVNTLFRGEKVDFWNQHESTGTVEHIDILNIDEGELGASFSTKLRHVSLKHGEVLEETWTIIPYPTDGFFLFDLLSEQVNTSEDTLFILEYHYGGMGFRGSKEWNSADTANYTNAWKILTSEGHDHQTANHTKAKWVSAFGEVESKVAGVTVFGFPDNFRYPQIVRVHPTMPYWVYSPMFEGEFHIAPGQKFYNKVRFYVHQGEPDEKILASIQADLTDPVQVKVKDTVTLYVD